MNKQDKLIYILSPTMLFFCTFVLLNLLPGLFIYFSKYQEGLYIITSEVLYTTATELYLIAIFIFLFTFSVSRYILFGGGSWFSLRYKNIPSLKYAIDKNRVQLFLIPFYIAWIGVALIWIYVAMGGYEKLLSLGSGMDSWEFRLIGYDDRSRFLIAALEASRRVLLPYAALYFFMIRSIGVRFPKWFVTFLLFTQFVGAIVTLDRAPILLFFIMLIYVKLCQGSGILYFVKIFSGIFITVLLLGGVTTFIQYNLSGFSLVDVLTTGLDFFIHRSVIVPSIASIELSFHYFPIDSEKLLLIYSRLFALIRGDYVGSQEILSIYVTPVGAIADIWRNLGFLGIFFVAIFLGWYFRCLDDFIRKSSPVMWVVGSFNVLSLCFYYVFGVFFSQGVFFQMALVYWLFRMDYLNYHRQIVRRRIKNWSLENA